MVNVPSGIETVPGGHPGTLDGFAIGELAAGAAAGAVTDTVVTAGALPDRCSTGPDCAAVQPTTSRDDTAADQVMRVRAASR
jgi:hypothetical protein